MEKNGERVTGSKRKKWSVGNLFFVEKVRKNVVFCGRAKKNKKNSKLLLTNRKVFDKIDFADARKVSKTKTKNLDN